MPGSSLRHEGIDALRGVAVILMVSQHLIAWLWNAPPLPAYALAQDHPILMGLNALGYLSAPLFILLAGAGTTMFFDRHGDKGAGTVLLWRGAYLLGLWGIAYPIIEAVAHHHHPARVPGQTEFGVLGATHVANALARQQEGCAPETIELDERYLKSLGVLDKLPEWRAIAAEEATEGREAA